MLNTLITIYFIILLLQVLFSVIIARKLELNLTINEYIILFLFSVFCVPIILGILIVLTYNEFKNF